MTFGQAFTDARDKKEPKFTWKGKEYTTQLAPSKPAAPNPSGKVVPANPAGAVQQGSMPAPAAATADGNAGEAEARAAMPTPAATTVPPELASVTDKTQPYWVNGTRYEWKNANPRRPDSTQGRWAITAQPGDKLQLNATRKKTMAKYTGPDSEFGKQPPAQLAQAVPTQETVGYSENQNLASIIHLAGLR
jgi:hypothetical protein